MLTLVAIFDFDPLKDLEHVACLDKLNLGKPKLEYLAGLSQGLKFQGGGALGIDMSIIYPPG